MLSYIYSVIEYFSTTSKKEIKFEKPQGYKNINSGSINL